MQVFILVVAFPLEKTTRNAFVLTVFHYSMPTSFLVVVDFGC
jgi:hypothetical protein